MSRLQNQLRSLLSRNWRRALQLRERFDFSEEVVGLLIAGAVGVLGGVVNLVFFLATETFMLAAIGRAGDPVLVAEILPLWQRAAIPALGGLASGLVLSMGLRLVGQQGTSNLLEAVAVGDGRLPFRTSLIKGASSIISIGSGASIGREGAITQLTAMLASKLGQVAGWPPYRLRLLVACGAAAGIAAPYNAPISGAVFAAWIVLGNFSMTLFAPLVLSSVVACVVSRSLFGIHATYSAPEFEFTRLSQLPLFVGVGLMSGVLGATFLKLLRLSGSLFQRMKIRLCYRMLAGGLVVGLIAMAYPEAWGNGAEAANRVLHGLEGEPVLLMLLGLFVAKLIATLATVGSGAVGGVFTPTLFLGTALGSLCGELAHRAGFGLAVPTPAFALVGMGGVLAATTHSPLLAMIMVFEISLNYSLMPALMLGCVISSVVARKLHRDSIYTATVRLQEAAGQREDLRLGAASVQSVGDLMHPPVPPLRETASLREIADRFLSSSHNFLPVVNSERRLVGMVALHDLKEFLGAGDELRVVIAYDLMRPPPPCLTPSQPLTSAFEVLLRSELRNVPVVDCLADMRLVGSLPRAEALALFAEAVSR